MKTCKKCKEEKIESDFFKDAATPGGYRLECKSCKNKRTQEWREKNRDRYNGKMREYNAKNWHRIRLMTYKLTPEVHAKMLSDQKGVCAICEKPPGGKRPLCVDHDHSTGKVRGLLCYGCNRALHILDTPDLLEKAETYLLKSK